MKKLYKSLLLCSLMFFTANIVCAQSLKDRFFFGVGFSYFTSYGVSPGYYNSDSTGIDKFRSIPVYSISFNPRINLVELSDNASISLDMPTTLGIGLSNIEYNRLGRLNLPIMLSLNTGNISTYSSDKNKGFVIGVGMELTKNGLFRLPMADESEDAEYNSMVHTWWQPVMNIGYRYWNKSNAAREVNLKVGYKGKTMLIKESYGAAELTQPVDASAYSIHLSFIRYMNY